ncbi:DUF4179 domain-containing protein [Paenibacillus camerounensis]|uniref:DUF4179 domain-containing protein n=1 Tax=Paenibacillus camerounensis TaxID=1243663 RepID=UPI0005A8E0EF|nr:DUF4179 domain-containing protein [Paenibacillus camerounensis]
MAKPNHTNANDWLDNEIKAYKTSKSSSLNRRFTEQVMGQVRQTEIAPLPSAPKQQRFAGLRWGAGILGGMALILVLYGLTRTDASYEPGSERIFQAHTMMPFNKLVHWTDPGMQNAQSLGLVQMPAVSITDQGYTLSLEEVIADDTRIVFSLLLTDSSGQTNHNWKNAFGHNMIQIKDEDGQEIAFFRSDIPLQDGGDEQSPAYENDRLWLTYAYDQLPGDHIIIESNVNRLNVKEGGGASTGLNGDWSFSYEVDISKSKELSTSIEMDQSYTTPGGLSITAQRLILTPTGALLQLETGLSDEASKHSPVELSEKLSLQFHLENEAGEEIGRINNYGFDGYSYWDIGYFKSDDPAGRAQQWTFALPYLPFDSSSIRLVLDGYSLPVQTNDSVTFVPEDLKNQPAVFQGQEDVLQLHDFEIKDNGAGSGPSGRLLISGEFVNSFQEDRWVVRDESGKTYNAQFTGHTQLGEIVIINAPQADSDSPSYFDIPGLTALPEKLTLIRTVTNKRYTDVDWSLDLPEPAGAKD